VAVVFRVEVLKDLLSDSEVVRKMDAAESYREAMRVLVREAVKRGVKVVQA